MKNLGIQVTLGAWAAIAVGMGIVSRSWETFFMFMAIFAFFATGCAAAAASHSPRPWVHRTGRVVSAVLSCVIALGVFAVGERIFVANAPVYPTWMAGDLGRASDLEEWMYVGAAANNGRGLLVNGQSVCKGRNAELFHKDGGVVVIRCGGLTWFDSNTYIAHMDGAANHE